MLAPFLVSRGAWFELKAAIDAISEDDVLAVHSELAGGRARRGQRAHAGGQTAINQLLERRLGAIGGWELQPKLFKGSELKKWKMDFLKEGIGCRGFVQSC